MLALTSRRSFGLLALLSIPLIMILGGSGLAADRTWTGANSADWSDDGVGGNWNDEAAPVDGDRVIYDTSSTANLSQNNDLGAGLSLSGIYVQPTPSGPVTISGNALTLSAGITNNTSRRLVINNDLTLSANISFSVPNPSQNTLNGDITAGTFNLTLWGLQSGCVFNLGGTISGSGQLTCSGTSGTECVVSAAQNYTGTTRIQGTATLRLSGGGDLPDSSYVLLNDTTSCLDLDGVSDTIGSLAGGGPVLLGGATLTMGGDDRTTNISGVISESGNIVKEGNGTLMLSGSNTYNGSTTINGGTLMALVASERIPDNSAVTINAGSLTLGGYDETIGSLTGSAGTIVNLSTGSLTTGGNGTSTTFAGVIQNSGNLTKEGAGTFTLSDNNTYTGATTVNAGTLAVDGTLASGSYQMGGGTLRLGAADRLGNTSTMTLATGATFDLNGFNQTIATLSGSGTVTTGAGVLTISTALNPGTSPGMITVGNFSLAAGALNVEIYGTTAGTGYDQITATGDVTLGGTLNLASSISPAGGTIFTIINKTSAGLVSGTFAGLAEGSSISAGGTTYKISYVGGDGNDVELTAQASSGGGGGDSDSDNEANPNIPSPPSLGQGTGPLGSQGGPVLGWAQVFGANFYLVYRAECPDCPREQVGDTIGLDFVDHSALPGQVYYYWVKAGNPEALSDFSDWVAAWRYEQNPGRAGDFNGDGISDLLWWDPATGQIQVWYMSGGQILGKSTLGQGQDISQWLLLGTGDYNGDGISDLLWWMPDTGQVVIWFMGAGAAASATGQGDALGSSNQSPGSATGNATLSYPGDLNGDGISDLVWRDHVTGQVTVWLLEVDGTTTYNDTPILADGLSDDGRPRASGSLSWALQGLYDMDGDGRADLVWRPADTGDGRVIVWRMDGAHALSYRQYQRSGDASGWRIAGLGDLNGDRVGDIVWRHDTSGLMHVWLVNQDQTGYEQHSLRITTDNPADWQVKAVGNFCSSSCADVYTRNSLNQEVRIITPEGEEFYPSAE